MNDFKILTTQISYFGYQLTLPIDSYEYKWIATDSNGDVLAYTHKPIPRKDTSKFGFDRNMHGLNFKILANVKFQGNWADSLVEIATLKSAQPIPLNYEIEPDLIKIETYRAPPSRLNRAETAIKVTHLPTGIEVHSEQGRSAHQNRAVALELLKVELNKRKQSDALQRFNTHFLTTIHADKVHKSVLNFWHAELQQFLIPEIQQEYEKWTAEQKS